MNEDEKRAAYPRVAVDFTPVARCTRKAGGWTSARQMAFIEALATTGSVRSASQAVGMSFASAYQLRRASGAGGFCAAWDTAIGSGVSQIYHTLLNHALNGVPEPVYWAGKKVAERRRFDHRTMRWIVENRDRGRHKSAGKICDAEVAKAREAWEREATERGAPARPAELPK